MAKWGDKAVAVHVEELYEAWRVALLEFSKELQKKPCKAVPVYQRADKFFANVGIEEYKSLLGGADEDA
jgi:hypothetical protein